MPLYDYQCPGCNEALEVLTSSAKQQAVACPSCGIQMERQVCAPSFRLKGGGWYETDFKSGAKRNLTEGDKGAADASSPDSSAPDSSAPNSSSPEAKSAQPRSDGGAQQTSASGGGDKPAADRTGGGAARSNSRSAASSA